MVLRTRSEDINDRIATLTLYARSAVAVFPDMKAIKYQRQKKDYVLWVWWDNRWKLKEFVFKKSYNRRDELGNVDPDTEKTIAELWEIIADQSGLEITVGNVPNYIPPAPWEGMTGTEAANDLLQKTSCRMVWNPTDQEYVISSAGDGVEPGDFDPERVFKPGPVTPVKNINVHSGPVLYEGFLVAEAVVQDSDGRTVRLDTEVSPIDFFTGFSTTAALDDRSRYMQSAFRLWRATQATFPENLDAEFGLSLKDRRGTTIIDGTKQPLSVSAFLVSPGVTTYPHYQFLEQTDSYDEHPLRRVPETTVYASESPIILVDGSGTMLTDAEILTSYNVVEADGKFRGNTETRAIDDEGDDVDISAFWITPLESEAPDASTAGDKWATLLAAYADALKIKFDAKSQTGHVATLVPSNGSGQIGAVLYEYASGYRGRVTTYYALNFVPRDWRSVM